MEAIEYLGLRKIVKIRINNGSRIKISIEPERAVNIWEENRDKDKEGESTSI